MRGHYLLLALIAALGGCKAAPQSAARDENVVTPPMASGETKPKSNGFPRAGMYDVVHERPGGREESSVWVDASNRQAFEAMFARDDGSNCRDRQVTIENGSFNVSMTCDAPDGDIHNIAIRRDGSYSEDSITITTETTLWGSPIRETTTYQRREN